jgi:hypothetical protein
MKIQGPQSSTPISDNFVYMCKHANVLLLPTHATSHMSSFKSEASTFHNSVPLNGHVWYNRLINVTCSWYMFTQSLPWRLCTVSFWHAYNYSDMIVRGRVSCNRHVPRHFQTYNYPYSSTYIHFIMTINKYTYMHATISTFHDFSKFRGSCPFL